MDKILPDFELLADALDDLRDFLMAEMPGVDAPPPEDLSLEDLFDGDDLPF